MNKYETIFIISENCSEEQINNIIELIKTKIESFSKNLISLENRGKKKLAYEIKNNSCGTYVIIKFKTEPKNIQELGRLYRITEEIIKFITIREEN